MKRGTLSHWAVWSGPDLILRHVNWKLIWTLLLTSGFLRQVFVFLVSWSGFVWARFRNRFGFIVRPEEDVKICLLSVDSAGLRGAEKFWKLWFCLNCWEEMFQLRNRTEEPECSLNLRLLIQSQKQKQRLDRYKGLLLLLIIVLKLGCECRCVNTRD